MFGQLLGSVIAAALILSEFKKYSLTTSQTDFLHNVALSNT